MFPRDRGTRPLQGLRPPPPHPSCGGRAHPLWEVPLFSVSWVLVTIGGSPPAVPLLHEAALITCTHWAIPLSEFLGPCVCTRVDARMFSNARSCKPKALVPARVRGTGICLTQTGARDAPRPFTPPGSRSFHEYLSRARAAPRIQSPGWAAPPDNSGISSSGPPAYREGGALKVGGSSRWAPGRGLWAPAQAAGASGPRPLRLPAPPSEALPAWPTGTGSHACPARPVLCAVTRTVSGSGRCHEVHPLCKCLRSAPPP